MSLALSMEEGSGACSDGAGPSKEEAQPSVESAKHQPWPSLGAKPKPTLFHLWNGRHMSCMSRSHEGCSLLFLRPSLMA